MTDATQLSTTFQDIIEMMGDSTPAPDMIAHPPETARAALRSILSRTVLPRRITVRGATGARLSMVVKNREIIRLAEVHPADLWRGDASPHETACRDDDDFAHPFASALTSVIGTEPIRIEQALLTDPLGLTRPGFPAARVADTAPEASGGPVEEFFDAFPALPRARFGNETVFNLPTDSPVDQDWMQARVDALTDALESTESSLQFMMLDGPAPIALALVWQDGEGCILLATAPDDFTKIERYLDTLRAKL